MQAYLGTKVFGLWKSYLWLHWCLSSISKSWHKQVKQNVMIISSTAHLEDSSHPYSFAEFRFDFLLEIRNSPLLQPDGPIDSTPD